VITAGCHMKAVVSHEADNRMVSEPSSRDRLINVQGRNTRHNTAALALHDAAGSNPASVFK
jgi:hypothetical protein